MAKATNQFILFEEGSNIAIICKKDDWTKCPEHKHLTETPTHNVNRFDSELVSDANAEIVDDPNDDIVSINEYADSQSESYTVEGENGSYVYDPNDERQKMVAQAYSMDPNEEGLSRMRNRYVYDIRGMGIGFNFDVMDTKKALFSDKLKGKCESCGATVTNGERGVWMHSYNGVEDLKCQDS